VVAIEAKRGMIEVIAVNPPALIFALDESDAEMLLIFVLFLRLAWPSQTAAAQQDYTSLRLNTHIHRQPSVNSVGDEKGCDSIPLMDNRQQYKGCLVLVQHFYQ